MSDMKKIWITPTGDRSDLFALSFRQEPNTIPIHVRTQELPPTEPINGKKLNFQEAMNLRLIEHVHVVTYLTRGDLHNLRDRITEALK